LLILEVLREAVMWSPANGHELAGASGVRRDRPLTQLLRWLLRAVLACAPAPHDTSATAADAGDAVDAGERPRWTRLDHLSACACQVTSPIFAFSEPAVALDFGKGGWGLGVTSYNPL
jgi:hypothetical protein